MDSLYDAEKDKGNIRKHGISLSRYVDFDMSSAYIVPDDSQDYGEARYIGVGFLDARLHVLIFTVRLEQIRPISLRGAKKREAKEYAENTQEKKARRRQSGVYG